MALMSVMGIIMMNRVVDGQLPPSGGVVLSLCAMEGSKLHPRHSPSNGRCSVSHSRRLLTLYSSVHCLACAAIHKLGFQTPCPYDGSSRALRTSTPLRN
ncbi:hypothetical protein EDC04DRAFT_1615014 [Pisolithus marmoratus]|nr:hypothetical protein EDC04DRAFT_1615014 [Pisolithus marmoratus]